VAFSIAPSRNAWVLMPLFFASAAARSFSCCGSFSEVVDILQGSQLGVTIVTPKATNAIIPHSYDQAEMARRQPTHTVSVESCYILSDIGGAL